MINPEDAIKIQTESYYVDEQSDPKEERYVFAYTITIHNKGQQAIQLKSRYWLITDSNGKKAEVQGDGVIGQQPVIRPNGKFQYTSGAVVDTPVATMEGYYDMVEVESEKTFKAPISVFRLAQPNILN